MLISAFSMSVDAAYNNTKKSFKRNEGGFLGIGTTSYPYKIYKDSSEWYVMRHDLDVCPAIYHRKGSGSTNLTYSRSKTYSSQTAYAFSCSVGCNVAISELVGLTASATGGKTKTYSYSVAASGSVGKVISSNSKTGYYKMTICHNFNKFRLDKCKTGSSKVEAKYYPAVPKGNPYVAVLYSSNSSNNSYKKF